MNDQGNLVIHINWFCIRNTNTSVVGDMLKKILENMFHRHLPCTSTCDTLNSSTFPWFCHFQSSFNTLQPNELLLSKQIIVCVYSNKNFKSYNSHVLQKPIKTRRKLIIYWPIMSIYIPLTPDFICCK